MTPGVVGEAFMPRPKADGHNNGSMNTNPYRTKPKGPLKIQEREGPVTADMTGDAPAGRNEKLRKKYGLIDLS